ncbi:APC family permease [Pseudonocardia acaciae]|uniref:APC family permease n=1 Tax=Pseudonocardia acaciae TaxID=551276 RepID=UPI0009FBE47B|nr:APC family permease [Pseudonocardia acaciae]
MSETTRDLDASVPLSDKGLRRDIGKLGLLFVSCGAIIGSSWLFVPVTAAKLAGPAAVVSWVIGIVLILLIVVTFAELSAMFPVAGGVSRFPQYSFGSFASYTMGWITWLAIAAVPPIEVLATLQYASAYLPYLFERADDVPVLTPVGIAVSVVLVSVILLTATFDSSRFTAASTGGFAPYGFGSVLSAVASGGIVFSFLGCRQAVDLAAESTRPHRNVPFALLGSALLCGVILIFLQVAVTGAVPADALAGGWAHLALADGFGPLAGLAGAVGLTWLVVLIRVDAVVSPFDTGLIYAASAARVSYAQG